MTNHVLQADDELLVNNDEDRENTSVNSSPDPINHHPVTPATIQTAILSGNITYSNDPEGKDLNKGWINFSVTYIFSQFNHFSLLS